MIVRREIFLFRQKITTRVITVFARNCFTIIYALSFRDIILFIEIQYFTALMTHSYSSFIVSYRCATLNKSSTFVTYNTRFVAQCRFTFPISRFIFTAMFCCCRRIGARRCKLIRVLGSVISPLSFLSILLYLKSLLRT